MRCFFCKNINSPSSIVALDRAEKDHLFKTLKGKPGDQIRLIDGHGTSAIGQVTTEKEILITHTMFADPLFPKIHLFVAPPRRNQMEQLLRQCAEVGVWSVVPIVTHHSVAVPAKESMLERWRSIMLEGCKQSGNPYLPGIRLPVPFEMALRMIQDERILAFYGDCTGSDETVRVTLGNENIAWIVGPEGGFSQRETDLMRNAGFDGVKICPWTMRVETAAVCGVALLRYQADIRRLST